MTAALAALALLLAPGASPEQLSVDPAASAVRFHVNHKLHAVDGASRAVEGRAVLEPGGAVKAMVRIPVQSFDSGDANRDAHMLETLEAGRFPHVVFKGVGSAPGLVAGGPPAEVRLRGELDLHGVRRPLEVALQVERAKDGSLRARGRFVVSLDAHGVVRPSLLMVKLDDECAVELDLRLRSAP